MRCERYEEKNIAVNNWKKDIKQLDTIDLAIIYNFFSISIDDLMLRGLRKWKKMKKTINKIGNIVAIMLMIMPIVIVILNDKIGNYWWILLILSVCYDSYIYSLIQFDEKMNNNRKLYLNVLKGKVIESNSEEKKQKWYEVMCINLLHDYFKDDLFK